VSLYPGAPRLVNPGDPPDDFRYELDDTALEQSMAEAMEDEMRYVFEKVKRTPIPEVGQDDRRLLFVAISRGVLRCLRDHQTTMSITGQTSLGTSLKGDIDLDVMMEDRDTLRINRNQIAPGGASDGTIELRDRAPAGGATVTLSSDNPLVATASPSSVMVPEGQRSASLKVVAAPSITPIDAIVHVTASFAAGGKDTARLRVLGT
jgi:hypothetical protein